MAQNIFAGVMTALITPFDAQNHVDYPTLKNLLQYQKNSGINGVVMLGTTGENITLTESEAEQIVRTALEYQDANFKIYVGTGSNDTRVAIEKSIKYAKLLTSDGRCADGIMVVTPYYNKPNARCLIAHYNAVAQAVPNTPICIYNVPGRTGINILPQTLVEISKNPNIVAIKEAAGNVSAIAEMRLALNKNTKQQVRILSGDDATFAPALLCGAEGVISVTSHVIPGAMLQILAHFHAGDISALQKLHLSTYCINNGIFSVPNPIGVKWILSTLGVCGTTLRPPLYAADANEAEVLRNILTQLEVNNIRVLN